MFYQINTPILQSFHHGLVLRAPIHVIYRSRLPYDESAHTVFYIRTTFI